MSKEPKTKAPAQEPAPAQVVAVKPHGAINYTGAPDLNIYQKIAAITGEIGAIAKGGTNRDQGYAFIEYAAVAGELRGLFAKYGVVITPDMQKAADQKREEITTRNGGKGVAALIDFTFNIINADKPDDRFTVNWVGEATDYGDKATNKAATAAIKYYLMRQFNVSEKGEAEADRETIERAPADHAPAVRRESAPAEPTKSKPAAMTQLQKENISKALTAKGIEGADQRTLILKMAKVDDASKISVPNARTILEKIEGATGEKLFAFLAGDPVIDPSTAQPDAPADVPIVSDDTAVASDDAGAPQPTDEPVEDEPTGNELGGKPADTRPVDDAFKDGIMASLDALGLSAPERMRLLKDATGALSPIKLTDEQWRKFADAVDDYAIEHADKITASDGKGNTNDAATQTEQTTTA